MEHKEELRCVIAVIRHGDRTPKQKMKMLVRAKKRGIVRGLGWVGLPAVPCCATPLIPSPLALYPSPSSTPQ